MRVLAFIDHWVMHTRLSDLMPYGVAVWWLAHICTSVAQWERSDK